MDGIILGCLVILIITLVVLLAVTSIKNKHLDVKLSRVAENMNDLKVELNTLQMMNHQSNEDFRNDMQYQQNELKDDLNRFMVGNREEIRQFQQYQMAAVSKLVQQASNMENSGKQMAALTQQIHQLESILGDKKQRGIFGESLLYLVYEKVFGKPGRYYATQYKLSNGFMVDSIIFAPESLGHICVDSKFPLENYNKIYSDHISSGERISYQKFFRNDVKNKINEISNKYIIPGETADFAMMFIPAESVYNEIIANYQELVDYSFERHVYLTSPTNLFMYLSTIESLWLKIAQSENVEKMQQEFKLLSDEFERFKARYSTVERDAQKLSRDISDLNITSEKITKRFNQIILLDDNRDEPIIEWSEM
ncbi:MAG: DNA recombination protein RmuC [Erysipelotrichaceae bacterium]|nr:DNA recombination protein RmuC [Erysipelotrichaceae bacterium]